MVYLKDDINCTVSFFGAGVLDEDMHLQIGDGCKEAVINPENEKLPFGGKHIIIIGELLQMHLMGKTVYDLLGSSYMIIIYRNHI